MTNLMGGMLKWQTNQEVIVQQAFGSLDPGGARGKNSAGENTWKFLE